MEAWAGAPGVMPRGGVCGGCVNTGVDGMNWEVRTDVCALPHVKQKVSGKLLYSTGSSAQCSVVT